MNAITIRFLAMTATFAVLFTFSVPAQAALYATPSSAYTRLQTDDDDDSLSGGALAVLLLAVGGAVAGDLYGPGSIRTRSRLSFNRVSASTATVSVDRKRFGRRKTIGWTSVLDGRSGTIKLSGNGRQWTGKTDGRFYAIKGDPTADELSVTSVNDRSLEFRTRKAGRVGYGGTITISDNGRSVTMHTAGIRGSGQVVFSAR
ncbi:MAG TPA: hypothetical protein VFZ23_14260 [Pyrinomonadaceae bacterium]